MSETAAMVTVSIGVALAAGDSCPETVAQWADEALYMAKRQGRNQVCLFADRASSAQAVVAAPSLAFVTSMDEPALALAR